MALDATQKVNVRRWAGYPAMADTPATDSEDIAYIYTRNQITTLEHRLTNLSAEEETALIDIYLTKLATLETAITDMSDNLDTDAAGTYKANPREMSQRFSLFTRWCRAMCNFLGLEPGPGLSTGGMTIVRC